MAARAPSRVACLFCQQLPHRSLHSTKRRQTRKLHAQARPAVKEDMLAQVYHIPTFDQVKEIEGDGPQLSQNVIQDQLDLHSPVDVLREVLLHNMAPTFRHDHIRYPAQQALSLPLQPADALHKRTPFPLSGNPLPHPFFRDVLKSSPGAKEVRRVMREQLLRCQFPRDILRVMAVAMQRKETAREMARMQESLRRALYRIRNNVSDEDVLKTINVVVNRLTMANLPVPEELLKLGVKFAARCRSLSGMKRYLKEFKDSGGRMTRGVFRSIIAKFSIGARGLGEIRNGRWKRKELLQVLLGFEDTPPEQAHHLGVFLHRDDWQFYHGWLAVLARCKAVDELWEEWNYWLKCGPRNDPRNLHAAGEGMTTRVRGDYWFVEQMTYAGDLEKAWEMLRISAIPFANVRSPVRARLLEGAQYATIADEEIRNELLRKYAAELEKIETALAVRWVSGEDGHGHHISQNDMEERLETLASEDFVLQPDFGFPWDESSAEEREEERNIMEAEEEDKHRVVL